MKRNLQYIKVFVAALISFFWARLQAFAQVTGGASQSQVQSAAQKIINVLNGFGLPYIEAALAIGITMLVVAGVVKASRAKNVSLLWTEITFGALGIILVLNPLLLINAFLTIGAWF